jgi:hypothetical protein
MPKNFLVDFLQRRRFLCQHLTHQAMTRIIFMPARDFWSIPRF